MPAVFIGHGSPMNTLEVNRFTEAWRALARALPRPRAILVVSAHWYLNGTAVTAMPRPRVIHDFYGFPRELFEFDYPAPGSPELAEEIVEAVKPAFVGLDHDSWGLDHGTWSVLAHMFPEADVPVVQLSIHGGRDVAYHLDLGRRLAALRDREVFILCSGNVVHNLGRVDRALSDRAFQWADRFDAAVKELMTTEPANIGLAAGHPDFAMSVPTPDHFLPLVYLSGLCAEAGQPATTVLEGGTLGSITMTSYALGLAGPIDANANSANAAPLPDAQVVPPEDTNA
jgi:4,5-DOPA dioxygenase extradiol